MTVAPVSYKCWDHPDLVMGFDLGDIFTVGGNQYVRDKTGKGRHAQVVGSPDIMPSMLPAKRMEGGKCLYFDATNDYLLTTFADTITEFTVIVFAKNTDAGNTDVLIGRGNNEHLIYHGALASGGGVYLYSAGSYLPAKCQGSNLQMFWGMATSTYMKWGTGGGGDTIYNPEDGQWDAAGGDVIRIGARQDLTLKWAGVIDTVLLFNRVLSDAELRKIWDSAMALPREWGDVKTGVKGAPVNLCRAIDCTDDPYNPGYWNSVLGNTVTKKTEGGYDTIKLQTGGGSVYDYLRYSKGASMSSPTFLNQMCGFGIGKKSPDRYNYLKFDMRIKTAPTQFVVLMTRGSDLSTNYIQWNADVSKIQADKWTSMVAPISNFTPYIFKTAEANLDDLLFGPVYGANTVIDLEVRNIRFGKYAWNVIDFDRPEDANLFTTTKWDRGLQVMGEHGREVKDSKVHYYRKTAPSNNANYWGIVDEITTNITGDFVAEAKVRVKLNTSSTATLIAITANNDYGGLPVNACEHVLNNDLIYQAGADSTGTGVKLTERWGTDRTVIIRIIRRNGVMNYETDAEGGTIHLGTSALTATVTKIGIHVAWYGNISDGDVWCDWIRWREL